LFLEELTKRKALKAIDLLLEEKAREIDDNSLFNRMKKVRLIRTGIL
jgi:hypothetical protein